MTIKKSIQLTTEPLEELIERGETIDFRLDEPQWIDLKIDDIIEFWEDFTGWQTEPTFDSRRVIVRITDIFRVATFEDLLNHHKLATFFKDHDKDMIITSLRQWWTKERETQTGVLGLRVTVIS